VQTDSYPAKSISTFVANLLHSSSLERHALRGQEGHKSFDSEWLCAKLNGVATHLAEAYYSLVCKNTTAKTDGEIPNSADAISRGKTKVPRYGNPFADSRHLINAKFSSNRLLQLVDLLFRPPKPCQSYASVFH